MFTTLANAFKVKDIRKKIFYTLLLVLIYRLGAAIPIPGVNVGAIADAVQQYDILGFLNLLSGGSFSSYTIFAMGITPYITGSIIIQLLTIVFPSLERISREADGRKKIERITRFVGIGLALVQSIGIILGLGSDVVYKADFFTYATIGIISTAGTAFLIWLGERITEDGIGNGISLLIFTSIVSQVPTAAISLFQGMGDGYYSWWCLPVLIVLILLIIGVVVYVDQGERRVPVQYAKRVVGRKMYGGQSTHIPIKANSNGVMPLIFAMTIIQFPGMIAQFWPDGGFYAFYLKYLAQGTVVHYVIYAILIIAFAYFYTTISFNPIEMSRNLQQYGGFIPGIRPGKPTSDYLHRISSRLTLFGALFLAVIAIIPNLFLGLFNISSAFGPTSVLIMVSVALETIQQLENLMLMRHYKGFLNA